MFSAKCSSRLVPASRYDAVSLRVKTQDAGCTPAWWGRQALRRWTLPHYVRRVQCLEAKAMKHATEHLHQPCQELRQIVVNCTF